MFVSTNTCSTGEWGFCKLHSRFRTLCLNKQIHVPMACVKILPLPHFLSFLCLEQSRGMLTYLPHIPHMQPVHSGLQRGGGTGAARAGLQPCRSEQGRSVRGWTERLLSAEPNTLCNQPKQQAFTLWLQCPTQWFISWEMDPSKTEQSKPEGYWDD